MRDGFKMVVAGVVGSIILGAPAVAVEKLRSGGDVLEAVVKESGGAVKAGMTEVQGIGAPAAAEPTTDTTAPDAGSGRG